MPEPERRIWNQLRARQVNGHKFRRQYSIGKYIIDFYCPEAKLALEIDGDSHFNEEQRLRDITRQQYIESKGIHFLRFTNTDILENLDGVLVRIAESLKHE
jgi:very-short-patch-repair endonuclease